MAQKLTKTRISSEARRVAICEAAIEVVGESGFAGAKTSMISARSGVSEALIFRHFKNKEDLFMEALSLVSERDDAAITRVMNRFHLLEPSATSLVEMVYTLLLMPYMGKQVNDKNFVSMAFILIRSLIGDKSFAEQYLLGRMSEITVLMDKSLEAAFKTNEITDQKTAQEIMWYVHNFNLGYFVSLSSSKSFFGRHFDEKEMIFNLLEMIFSSLGLKQKYSSYPVDFSEKKYIERYFK